MSVEMVFETVPLLRRRQGDNVVQGANNATLILGRDRPGSIESGFGSFSAPGGGVTAGSIHLVVGRRAEDPSLLGDRATVYISSRTDVDGNADIPLAPRSRDGSAVTIRADAIRIVPRRDFRVYIGERSYLTIGPDGNIVLEGEISLGKDAAERLLKGETFVRWAESHKHPTPNGLSGTPVEKVPEAAYSQRPARVY